jgi:hypothetical protein
VIAKKAVVATRAVIVMSEVTLMTISLLTKAVKAATATSARAVAAAITHGIKKAAPLVGN